MLKMRGARNLGASANIRLLTPALVETAVGKDVCEYYEKLPANSVDT